MRGLNVAQIGHAGVTAHRASCARATWGAPPIRMRPWLRRSASARRCSFDTRLTSASQPWPPFGGRAAEIAIRLVAGLAIAEPRRGEFARICHWRAGLRWESLEQPSLRDRLYVWPRGRPSNITRAR